jgi:hypothetical protein
LINLAALDCSWCEQVQTIPKELTTLVVLICDGCIILYIPSTIAEKVSKKSRGGKIRDWICRAQYRAARNTEKRAAMIVLRDLTFGSSQVFDKNVAAVFNKIQV